MLEVDFSSDQEGEEVDLSANETLSHEGDGIDAGGRTRPRRAAAAAAASTIRVSYSYYYAHLIFNHLMQFCSFCLLKLKEFMSFYAIIRKVNSLGLLLIFLKIFVGNNSSGRRCRGT